MRTAVKLFTSLFFFVLLVACACNGPNGPHIINPREFTWITDTLSIPNQQILMSSVWGTTDNLYAVGHSSGSVGTMWHYDGAKWLNEKLGVFEGGQFQVPFNFSAVHGINENDVFAVGNHSAFLPGVSFVIHYDGNEWQEQPTPEGGNMLLSVWANGPNDVWACGWNGTLLHYDGVQWSKDSVEISTPTGSTFYLTSIASIPSGELFMIGNAYESGSSQMPGRQTHYFFKYENGQWNLLDSFIRYDGENVGKWGGSQLTVLPTGTMYSVDGYRVFRWNGVQWIPLYDHINDTIQIFGTSDDNLFVPGAFGLLVHYNGTDWYEYRDLARENTLYVNGWADEKQAFVFGWVNGEKTVVLHGIAIPKLFRR